LTLDLAGERKLLTIPVTRTDEPGHTGGNLAFGPGGNLYIGVGDDINAPPDSAGRGRVALSSTEFADFCRNLQKSANCN
jgi:glucose/arabinose dehydrogenase